MSIKEALYKLAELCQRRGWMKGGELSTSEIDVGIEAAEAAVLALYEKQKAIADELAEALNNMVAFHVCDNCLWPGHSCREKDCHGVAQVAAAALAAYNKAKEG